MVKIILNRLSLALFVCLPLVALPGGPAHGGALASAPAVTARRFAAHPPLKPSLRIGEKLSYLISWSNFVVAGQLTMEIRQRGRFFHRNGLHLAMQAQSIGLVRTLVMAVDDQYASFVEPETLLPFRAETTIREGAHSIDRVIVFDRSKRSARLNNNRPLPIHRETRDIVSLLYYLRTLDYSEGKSYKLPVMNGKDRFAVQVSADSKGEIKTPAGRFEAIGLALRFEDPSGELNDRYGLHLWLSDDEQRLPLVIIAKLEFGEVRADLSEVSSSNPDERRSSKTNKAVARHWQLPDANHQRLGTEAQDSIPYGHH